MHRSFCKSVLWSLKFHLPSRHIPVTNPNNSKCQNTIFCFNTEVEYRAMADTSMELKWLCRLLRDIGVLIPPRVPLYYDNQSTISIESNHMFHERTKYIEVNCHVIGNRPLIRLLFPRFLPKNKRIMFSPRLNPFLSSDIFCPNSLSLIYHEFERGC